MNRPIKEAYKERIKFAVEVSNYLNNPEITLDAENLRYSEDRLTEAMAVFMNEVKCYINEMYGQLTSGALSVTESGKLKREILNTINYITGATMSFGKGLTLNKYAHILKRIVADVDPDEVIE